MQLAPALCWLRRQPRPSSRGRAEVWPTNRRAAGDRPCGDGATQLRWALTALGTCGAADAILLDRSKNSSRKVEMCVLLLHKSTESWYWRLFAINFLRRHVNKYFRLWRRAAPPMVATAATGPPCGTRMSPTSAHSVLAPTAARPGPPVGRADARTAGAPTEELLETGPVAAERPNFGGR